MFICCSFDVTENELNHYRGKDCMKSFCKNLRKHATKIINCEKKGMTPLTVEENKPYHKQNVCYIRKKEFSTNDKKYYNVKDHCHFIGKYRGAAHDTKH